MKTHPLAPFGRVPDLSRLLTEAAERGFGVTGLEAPFVALKDLSLGDLGTDFPLRLAAAIRKSASEITDSLLSNISSKDINFKIYEGFLNIKLGSGTKDVSFKSIKPLPSKNFKSAVLILAPRSTRESASGMLRRAALVGLQSLLLAEFCPKVSILDHEGAVLSDPLSKSSEFWEHVSKLSKQTPLRREEVTHLIEKVIVNNKSELTFVWSAEELWSQKLYRSLQSQTELVTQFASATWLEEWGGESECAEILQRIKDFPEDGLYVLSHLMRGSDLDGTVIGINERANLKWYVTATKARLTQLVPDLPKLNSLTYEGVLDDPLSRTIGIRSLFLTDFRLRAAWRGQVWDYLEALGDLLDSTQRLLNDPQLRQSISRGDFSMMSLQSLGMAKDALQSY